MLQKVLPDWFLGGEGTIASTKQKRNKQKREPHPLPSSTQPTPSWPPKRQFFLLVPPSPPFFWGGGEGGWGAEPDRFFLGTFTEYSAPDKTLDAQIRAANHYDQKLYEFAGKLLDARKTACGI